MHRPLNTKDAKYEKVKALRKGQHQDDENEEMGEQATSITLSG